MRNAFAKELVAIASSDERIVLLTADMGNRLFDDFKQRFPNRFFNCGVAEANMMGMAAGMALCGMRPVVYTIASFITIRCLEQIKIDVCYHNLAVVIVGLGGGLTYAELGVTHESCEDIAFLRVLANMTVVCPADKNEVILTLRQAIKKDTPVYIRLGKKNELVIHKELSGFEIGKGIIVSSGSEVCLLGTGTILPVVIKVAEELKKQGVSAQVVSLHTVKPLDQELLQKVFSRFKLVVTVEEHSLAGGLGSSIAEWLTETGPKKARLVSVGIADKFCYEAGNQQYVRQRFGLTSEAITEKIMQRYKEKISRQVNR